MKKISLPVGLAIALLAPELLAADAYIHVFYDQVPLKGVAITLDDEPLGITDVEGGMVIEIEDGIHQLVITAGEVTVPVEFEIVADEDVAVRVNFPTDDDFQPQIDIRHFASNSTNIEEVVVLGVFRPLDDANSVERYATSITNAIDVAQLERFGDADVAAALNRVVGVAVTDDKYATVRGLDGRYISSTLNGLPMPSTDPQRRDVQLDLFPTSILGGVEIQKSYTPDQLATTTGGSIRIETRGIPEERIHAVSGGMAYNTDVTGEEVLKYRGSDGDWLGFDSDLRELPSEVLAATEGGSSLTVCDPAIDPVRCTSPLDAARLGVKFQDDYNVRSKTALPDASLSWAIGDRLAAELGEWGYYAAIAYDHETTDRGEAKLTNPLETTGSYSRTRETTSLSGYFLAGYEYGEDSEILSKTTALRSSDDTTRVEQGVDREDSEITGVILEWVERQFISQAFTGRHVFDFGADSQHSLDWAVSYSRTDREEPDRRQYTYFNGNLSTSAFERRWSDLAEDSVDLALDYTIPWQWGSNSQTEFKGGILWSDKEREVDLYRFGIRLGDNRDISLGQDLDLEQDILPYENFALDRVRLAANTTATDSYDSEEEIQAYYLTTSTDIGEHWSFLAGARFEDFSQLLEYPNEESASNKLDYDDWYPAVNLSWRPIESLQFRAGYSETASYPGLIERSESLSYDPDTDDPIFGNPNLEVSSIDNIDFRVEWYFSDVESVSLALFYKDIDRPIERAVPDASGSAARGITFVNQDSAELRGVELDANWHVLDRDEYRLFLAGNVAYIDSDVSLSEDSLRLEGAAADGRQLQGQSEYLGNIQIGFDHYPTEQQFTLLVNYFDDRIFRISRGANTGPEFEVGRVLVDFVYEKIFSEKITLEASIKNLLNEKVEFSRNGRVIESYDSGTRLGLSLTYNF